MAETEGSRSEGARCLEAYLDASATRIVQANDRDSHEHRLVHNLLDLKRLRFGQAAAEHSEVLAENEDRSRVDGALTGYNRVTGILLFLHTELEASVLEQLVVFEERALIQHDFNSLSGSKLALLMLRINAFLSSSKLCLGPKVGQILPKLCHSRNWLHRQRAHAPDLVEAGNCRSAC
eukprot:3592379-Rhodomonas_salina.1